jgi:hypothetical protein
LHRLPFGRGTTMATVSGKRVVRLLVAALAVVLFGLPAMLWSAAVFDDFVTQREVKRICRFHRAELSSGEADLRAAYRMAGGGNYASLVADPGPLHTPINITFIRAENEDKVVQVSLVAAESSDLLFNWIPMLRETQAPPIFCVIDQGRWAKPRRVTPPR